MKILLITNYWHPYRNAGAFRWIGLGKYIPFDVLTCHRPLKGEKDLTMPFIERKVFRFGYRLPAVIWGILALIPVLILRKYELYIFTSPPESLLFTAWILQKIGKKVFVDMRDSIDRERQPHKYLIKIYQGFYKQIKNVIVCAKIVDSTKTIIYHGYDDIRRDYRAFDPPVYYNCPVNYETYILLLRHGLIRDFSNKPRGYGSSSYHTIRYLGYEVNQELCQDEYGQHSWQEEAQKLLQIINQK